MSENHDRTNYDSTNDLNAIKDRVRTLELKLDGLIDQLRDILSND